jgi:RNA polymerase sigma-70 factor (ECF subfamily)
MAGRHRTGSGARLQAEIKETSWPDLLGAVGQHQDRQAFAQLFDHFAPRIKSYMLRSAANAGEAEELAQEVMLLVWRKAALFDTTSTGAAAWIFTIARNVRIDSVRRARRGGLKQVDAVEAEFLVDPDPYADARVASGQEDTKIRAALRELPAEQRQLVELSFFEDKPHAEISTLLGLPLGTVKSRLRLALEKLRKNLDSLS